ncbi:membrane cofactor protein-like [Myotis yumanensis]|uniref:membrane cofactor protein-like n=1 Tax=Myotis yumanensis TaxID=159337 RepID=UPI0038D4B6AF
MTASCKPRRAPSRRPESPFSWCFVGVISVTLVLLLPTSFGRCGKPPLYQSMQLKGTPRSSYLPGEKIFYECKPGYYYAFNYVLKTFCEKNSTWFPVDEACYKKACPTPNVKSGKVYDPQVGFELDKEAHFYCDYGFYLKGEPILTCKLSGGKVLWNHDIPTCEKILCEAPGNISNGKYTDSWRVVFEFNEVVTYTCDPSNGTQEYSLIGESTLTCFGPGKWSSDPPQCKVVQCKQPVLKHGKPVTEMKKNFSYQDEVAFRCRKGFYLTGSNPVFCGGNSTWEPAMPTCIRGPKSTRPTKPPVTSYLGYLNFREVSSSEEIVELAPGTIALFSLTIFVGIAVIFISVYKCLHRGK